MTTEELKSKITCGETTTIQFKEMWTSQKEIAKEMVAFANSRGGKILFGVKDKTGEILGLTYEQVQETSRELGNTANEQIRPTVYIDIDVVTVDDKLVVICDVETGKNKPYKTLAGEIWVKQGADKRRVTENSEILSLFQESGCYQVDLSPVSGTSMSDVNRYDIDDYLKRVHGNTLEGFGERAVRIVKNIHISHDNGNLTLAGYLFFSEHPEYNCPTCMVKAVSFFGNSIGDTQYRDTKEIYGRMPHVYEQCMAFLRTNLHSVQVKGASFNSLGQLEISEIILEEVVQNALVHRDLLRPAPVRLLVFNDRVEVISPGELAGGLTVDDIRNGKTYQRNPQMAIFAMNTMPFRGLGSGIVRILQEETDIILENDTSGKEFKVIIPRHDNVSITDTEEQSIVDKLSIRKIIVDKLSINEGLVDKLSINEGFTDKLVEIFLYINDNPHTTTEAISVFIGKGVSRTKNYMQALTELGLVCAEGGNKNRTFIVNRIKN